MSAIITAPLSRRHRMLGLAQRSPTSWCIETDSRRSRKRYGKPAPYGWGKSRLETAAFF